MGMSQREHLLEASAQLLAASQQLATEAELVKTCGDSQELVEVIERLKGIANTLSQIDTYTEPVEA